MAVSQTFFLFHILSINFFNMPGWLMAGTANYAGIVKWAQLDLQRIQHHDYVGHLTILKYYMDVDYNYF